MYLILAILAILSGLLTLWQWVAAWRFPLHRRIQGKDFAPPVTVLKPLKGLDVNTLGCLATWLTQDYPGRVEVLFGVASPDDPACEPVRQLIKAHPGCTAQLVLCPESLGANAKVSSLIQLMRSAQHDVIVVSDADVSVPGDFLQNLVDPFREPAVGLVNCFYRLANPATVAMRWEAIAINADFWSQVLQGRTMQPLDFALGAVMAARRGAIEEIGGFGALADYLADDFQLGNRIVRHAGKTIALCPVVVDCFSPPMNWREVWAHQLRWARTIRVCKPLPYAFSILSNATLWPLLWVLVQPSKWSLLTLVVCLLLRIAAVQTLQQRLGPIRGQRRFFWLTPVKELLQFALWIAAFAGNHINWRGQRFHLRRDGRLAPA
jgi:ceramide glucosyltransferase